MREKTQEIIGLSNFDEAVERKDYTELKTILDIQSEIDQNTGNSFCAEALCKIITRRDENLLKWIIINTKARSHMNDLCSPDLHSAYDRSLTPLMYAIVTQQPGMVKEILLQGGNINIADNLCHTAISYAIECQDLEIAKSVLHYKFDVNAPDVFGYTALEYAIIHGNPSTVQLLLGNANITDRAWQLANTLPQMKELLSQKVESYSDYADYAERNLTPLMQAIVKKQPALVEEILFQGEDINITDNLGHTAISYAIECQDPEIAASVLPHKFDMNVPNVCGHTALEYAIINHNLPAMRVLLLHGAKINDKAWQLAEEVAASFPKMKEVLLLRQVPKVEVVEETSCIGRPSLFAKWSAIRKKANEK